MPKDPLGIALHFLKFRPRSVFEVESKLKTKKFSPAEIKSVVDKLKDNKLLDDHEDFIGEMLDDYEDFKGFDQAFHSIEDNFNKR